MKKKKKKITLKYNRAANATQRSRKTSNPPKEEKERGTEYDQAICCRCRIRRKMKALAENKRSGLFGKAEMTKAEARKLGLHRLEDKKPKAKKMAGGGKVMKYNMGGKVPTYAGMPMMADGGMVKKKKKKVSKKKSIDGVARRGRTKGRMV
jgi:hypothetical protein